MLDLLECTGSRCAPARSILPPWWLHHPCRQRAFLFNLKFGKRIIFSCTTQWKWIKMPSSYTGVQVTTWKHMLILLVPQEPQIIHQFASGVAIWQRAEYHPTSWHTHIHTSIQNRGQSANPPGQYPSPRQTEDRSQPPALPRSFFHKQPTTQPAHQPNPVLGHLQPGEIWQRRPSACLLGRVSGPVHVPGSFCKKKGRGPARALYAHVSHLHSKPARWTVSVQMKKLFDRERISARSSLFPKIVE